MITATFCFLLTACGSGESTSEGSGVGSGSIQFTLVWENASPTQRAGKSPSGDVCVDYAIDTVDATVTDSADSVIGSGSWSCSAHQGSITNVEAGTGISLSVAGIVGSDADWQGQVTGITVNANQTTTVGPVVMNYYGDDSTVPTVSNHYPGSGGTGILRNTAVIITFSEYVVPASVNAASCSIVESGTTTPVSATLTYDAAQYRSTLTPDNSLKQNTSYTVTVTTDIEDLAGLHMASDVSWSFTTGETTGDYLIWDTRNWDENFWN
ncbi:MAG: Ig-like domain-containing protein [Desulfobacteraceae bacterium]